jgi:hypothetical protein
VLKEAQAAVGPAQEVAKQQEANTQGSLDAAAAEAQAAKAATEAAAGTVTDRTAEALKDVEAKRDEGQALVDAVKKDVEAAKEQTNSARAGIVAAEATLNAEVAKHGGAPAALAAPTASAPAAAAATAASTADGSAAASPSSAAEAPSAGATAAAADSSASVGVGVAPPVSEQAGGAETKGAEVPSDASSDTHADSAASVAQPHTDDAREAQTQDSTTGSPTDAAAEAGDLQRKPVTAINEPSDPKSALADKEPFSSPGTAALQDAPAPKYVPEAKDALAAKDELVAQELLPTADLPASHGVPANEASGLPLSAAGAKPDAAAPNDIGTIGSVVQGGKPPLQKPLAAEAPRPKEIFSEQAVVDALPAKPVLPIEQLADPFGAAKVAAQELSGQPLKDALPAAAEAPSRASLLEKAAKVAPK